MANLRTEDRPIGPFTIHVVEFDCLDGTALAAELGNLVFPLLGALDGLELDTDVEKLTPALAAVFSSLSPAKAIEIVCKLLRKTKVNDGDRFWDLSKEANIRGAFGSDMKSMFGACALVLEVSFGPLFAALKQGMAKLQEKTEAKEKAEELDSNSPQTP